MFKINVLPSKILIGNAAITRRSLLHNMTILLEVYTETSFRAGNIMDLIKIAGSVNPGQ